MTPQQMKKILDGAPEWATMYSVSDKCYYEDYAIYDDNILLSDLRAELGSTTH